MMVVYKRVYYEPFVVGNGDNTAWRAWADGMPIWVPSPLNATRYCRRMDAEAVHGEDDDAWTVCSLEDAVNYFNDKENG